MPNWLWRRPIGRLYSSNSQNSLLKRTASEARHNPHNRRRSRPKSAYSANAVPQFQKNVFCGTGCMNRIKVSPLRGCAKSAKSVSVARRSAARTVSCLSIFQHDKHGSISFVPFVVFVVKRISTHAGTISRSNTFRAFRVFRCKKNQHACRHAKPVQYVSRIS